MMEDRESAGYLLGETAHLLRVNAGLALPAFGTMTALGMVPDLYPDFASVTGLGSIAVSLFFQYEISSALLVHYDLLDTRDRRRRIWALLGLNLLSGIGILFGLVLLILPGVYLFVRWSAAVPALIAEDCGVSDSLSESGEVVQGRFWHVLGALLVVWTPLAAGAIASGLVPEGDLLIGSLVTNLAVNLSLIAGWHLAVAIYAGRRERTNLAEVFA